MKNPKNPNPNTAAPKPKQPAYRYTGEFLNLHTFKMTPVSIDYIELLAQQLVEWSSLKDSLKVTMFYSEKGIGSNTQQRWLKKCKKLKEAHAFAKRVVGDRREIEALKKHLDPSIVMKTMANYDQEWKDIEKWRSNLRKSEDEQKGDTIIKVEMPSYLEKDKK